jgi:hypothetical protein
MKISAQLLIGLVFITLVTTESIGQQMNPGIDIDNYLSNLRTNILQSSDMFNQVPNLNNDDSCGGNIKGRIP